MILNFIEYNYVVKKPNQVLRKNMCRKDKHNLITFWPFQNFIRNFQNQYFFSDFGGVKSQ